MNRKTNDRLLVTRQYGASDEILFPIKNMQHSQAIIIARKGTAEH